MKYVKEEENLSLSIFFFFHNLKYVKEEENLSLSILKGLLLNASKKHALWQYHLHVYSVKDYTKMTGRPPFLPIYSHEAYI